MEIKVNKKFRKEKEVEHFDPQQKSLGFLNQDEMFDLRRQICEADAEGYFMVYNGKKYMINKDGYVEGMDGKMWEALHGLDQYNLFLKMIDAQFFKGRGIRLT